MKKYFPIHNRTERYNIDKSVEIYIKIAVICIIKLSRLCNSINNIKMTV